MELLSHQALIEQAHPDTATWLVDGLIRHSSLGLVAGFPKCGKTWLALHLSHAVSTGTPFLGFFPTRRARVLFIAAEDSPQLLADRSRALLRGHPATQVHEGLHFLPQAVRIDTPAGVAALREAIRDTSAELVILDTLNRSHGLNENLQSHATQLICALGQLRQEFGCAILATHHLSKSARDGQGGRALRGSSVLHAGLENSLYIWPGEHPGQIKVAPESKFSCPEPFTYQQQGDALSIQLAHTATLPIEPVIGRPGAGIRFLRRIRRRGRR